MLVTAALHCPFCICSRVCQLKVENVVNPPQKPTASRLRKAAAVPLSAGPRRAMSQPSRSEPATLTARVAHGKRAGSDSATMARATEPAAPPSAIHASAGREFISTSPARRHRLPV